MRNSPGIFSNDAFFSIGRKEAVLWVSLPDKESVLSLSLFVDEVLMVARSGANYI